MQKLRLKFLNKLEKRGKNMVINEFPTGQILQAISIIECQDFETNELCLEQVQLIFEKESLTLLPIIDTDEIEIIQKENNSKIVDTSFYFTPFLCQKLMGVWLCENDQGYQDQVIFAFNNLHPSLAFISEGSVLKVFTYQQIKTITNQKQNQKLTSNGTILTR
jgi:hypothetical protein